MQRPYQFGTGRAKLCETFPGELAQDLFSTRGEANEHLPSVFLSPDAPDQPALLQPVDQSHRAMMAELQTLRQSQNGGLLSFRETAESEKQ